VVFLPGPVGGARTAALTAFQAVGGRVVAGTGAGRSALLGRSKRLARESSGVMAASSVSNTMIAVASDP
jgi:hypothetical protein